MDAEGGYGAYEGAGSGVLSTDVGLSIVASRYSTILNAPNYVWIYYTKLGTPYVFQSSGVQRYLEKTRPFKERSFLGGSGVMFDWFGNFWVHGVF